MDTLLEMMNADLVKAKAEIATLKMHRKAFLITLAVINVFAVLGYFVF